MTLAETPVNDQVARKLERDRIVRELDAKHAYRNVTSPLLTQIHRQWGVGMFPIYHTDYIAEYDGWEHVRKVRAPEVIPVTISVSVDDRGVSKPFTTGFEGFFAQLGMGPEEIVGKLGEYGVDIVQSIYNKYPYSPEYRRAILNTLNGSHISLSALRELDVMFFATLSKMRAEKFRYRPSMEISKSEEQKEKDALIASERRQKLQERMNTMSPDEATAYLTKIEDRMRQDEIGSQFRTTEIAVANNEAFRKSTQQSVQAMFSDLYKLKQLEAEPMQYTPFHISVDQNRALVSLAYRLPAKAIVEPVISPLFRPHNDREALGYAVIQEIGVMALPPLRDFLYNTRAITSNDRRLS